MKTYQRLYTQITCFANLVQAFKRASRGKRAKSEVAQFEFDLEENLLALQTELETLSYKPGAYRHFTITDPKRRLISAAPFRDRVVHHALCQVIEPLFERRFIYDSYACRTGKGTHAAIRRAQHFARGFPFVLQCDLQQFFPSIDHILLQAELARLIRDEHSLRLIGQILEGGAGIYPFDIAPWYFAGDNLLSALRPRGLPIGNLTSQFWANVYLNPLDQFVKRELKCQAYLRYVDDFLLFAPNKMVLHAWRQAIIEFAAGLRQRLHEDRAVVFPTSTGIPFLGWRIFPDHLRLKRRNGVAFQRRFSHLRNALALSAINFDQLNSSVQGWVAHVAHGQTWGLRRALLSKPVLRKS